MSNVISINGAPLAHDPALRGYHVAYRPNQVNACPGCGRSHWLVGRLMAECAFCATALPMLDGGTTGIGLFRGLHREHQLAA
jgi:hypothetical protein